MPLTVLPLTAQGAPRIGLLPSGALDALNDVPGVTVGHCTLDAGGVQSGVSIVLPQPGALPKMPESVFETALFDSGRPVLVVPAADAED